jgi:hypothetical protein
MHLHRGFGDADIVGNLFAQAAARHLNGNWSEVDDALRPLRVPRKCMKPFWMPHCRGNRGSRLGSQPS